MTTSPLIQSHADGDAAAVVEVEVFDDVPLRRFLQAVGKGDVGPAGGHGPEEGVFMALIRALAGDEQKR